MACLGVRPGGGMTAQSSRVKDRVKLPGSVTIRVKPTLNFSPIKCTSIKVGKRKTSVGGGGGQEKFDRWMTESVGEIVKNLREAPIFVHVYGGEEPDARIKTEKAVEEEWVKLKGKWVKGEEASPEGVILVEELKEGEEKEGQNGKSTKAFGVLVQGKGEEGGIACYLLKTSSVGCGNLGLLSTHFCLVKVHNFRESVGSQLTNCWLA